MEAKKQEKKISCFHVHIAEANMLYLETPVGVGFSYSSDTPYATVDDEITGIFLPFHNFFS